MFNNIIYKSDLFQVAALIKDEDTAQNLRHELRSVLGKLSAVPIDTVSMIFSPVGPLQAGVVGVCARQWLELHAVGKVLNQASLAALFVKYVHASIMGPLELRNADGSGCLRVSQVRRDAGRRRTELGEGVREELLRRGARPGV